ncbi:hypothetical protein GF326_12745 [Candidatus Bathyarchaeota archaeon]|nr:hypothetical protein [Candidatus Bathyarchaeota archaeon]
MTWLNESLKLLKQKYQNKPFSATEAHKTLKKEKNYSRNTVYNILHELYNNGSLMKLGRGVYQIPERHADLHASFIANNRIPVKINSPLLEKAMSLLDEIGVEYMVTGPSTLTGYHHYFSRRALNLVYVIQGAGDYALKTLKDEDLTALLDPTLNQLQAALDLLDKTDIFIIREFAELRGNMDGKASLERAIIDTYFETTRNKIPFSEIETGRIIANIFRQEKLDITHLLNIASRRGIRDEITRIVKELIPSYPVEPENNAKGLENVIQGIRE